MERFHRAGRNELACNSWANLLAAEDKMEMFYMAREAVVKYMGMTMENMGELADQQINESSSVAASGGGGGGGGGSNGGGGGGGGGGGHVASSAAAAAAAAATSSSASASSDYNPTNVSPHDLSPTNLATAAGRCSSSSSEAIPVVSVSTMMDSSEFRSQMGEAATYQTLNGRMSPGYSPNNSYATLTPLQPLPPISTVSDKFTTAHHHHHGVPPGTPTSNNVSGSFTLMQNNGLGLDMNYRYDKLTSMGMSPMSSMMAAAAATNGYQQGLSSPYGYGQNNGLHSPKPEPKMVSPNYEYRSSLGVGGPPGPSSSRLPSPSAMMATSSGSSLNGLQTSANNASSPHSHHSMSPPQRERPSSSSESQQSASSNNKEVEEINTKELAQKISSELKRYSIPQAVFAQRVLCRSQGTLSDLLRNPKPWSKLKSGRETFRRMWKWLQEPEFQRMSALRLAVGFSGQIQADQGYPTNLDNTHNHLAKQCESVDLPSGVSCRPSVSPYIWLDKSTGGMPRTTLKDQGEISFYSSSGLDNDNSTGEVLGTTTLLDHQLGGEISFITNSPADLTDYWTYSSLMRGHERNYSEACKRKEQDPQNAPEENRPPKKPRLVFTDIQRRTLHAIFKETKRPSKEMQATIAQQLGLEVSTVANFFMNARRRSLDKWRDDNGNSTRDSGSTCTKS